LGLLDWGSLIGYSSIRKELIWIIGLAGLKVGSEHFFCRPISHYWHLRIGLILGNNYCSIFWYYFNSGGYLVILSFWLDTRKEELRLPWKNQGYHRVGLWSLTFLLFGIRDS